MVKNEEKQQSAKDINRRSWICIRLSPSHSVITPSALNQAKLLPSAAPGYFRQRAEVRGIA